MGDETDGQPSLADTIAAVRRELHSALTAGTQQSAQFRAGPVELDFEIAVTCTGDGPEAIHLSVLTPGAQSAFERPTTQRIKVTLQPLDPHPGEKPIQPPSGIVAEPHEWPIPGGELPERPVRAEGIEVNEVADGIIVYQADPERVHKLNNTAAIVLELCDGTNTVPEISEQLTAVFDLRGLPEGMTEQCIADLRSKGVVL